MFWDLIIVILTVILSIYGCIKFNINMFLSILIILGLPIIMLLSTFIIDGVTHAIKRKEINHKSLSLTAKIKKELNDLDYNYYCYEESDEWTVVKMIEKNSKINDEITIYLNRKDTINIVDSINKIKPEILKVRNKKIFDILNSLTEKEIKEATISLFKDLYNMNIAQGIEMNLNINIIEPKIDSLLESLNNIKKESLPNNDIKLNTYYSIQDIIDNISDVEFLDMIYTENSFILERHSESANIIAAYIFNKIYDIENDKFI